MNILAAKTKIVDEYSLAARPAQFCFGSVGLGVATVFFWLHDNQNYLITNWHNVTGVNPIDGSNIHSRGGRPTSVEVAFLKADQTLLYHIQSYSLYDDEGVPLWKVHREHSNKVDVVALPIEVPDGYNCFAINQMAQSKLKVRVGHDLYVLGFPFSSTIFSRGGLPIWKRASLASEPDWVLASELYCLVDTASRQGMSGAPVIRRAYAGAEYEDGRAELQNATMFYGVYAGRIVGKDESDAQLGRVYERKLIEEIVACGVRQTSWEKPSGELPKTKLVSLIAIGGETTILL